MAYFLFLGKLIFLSHEWNSSVNTALIKHMYQHMYYSSLDIAKRGGGLVIPLCIL